MGNDIEIRVRVANQTRSGVASVRQSIVNGLRGAPASVPVTVDNQTASGIARVQAQLRQLRAQSPVRLTVRFDDQSGQVNSSARALRTLDSAAQRASDAMTNLAARSMAASVALQRLAAAAEDAKEELNELRAAAARAATAVGRLGGRANDTEGRLFNLTSTASHLTIQMDDLGGATRGAGDDLRSLRGDLGRLTISAGNAAGAIGGGGGSGGMGLRGQLIGVAAALGTTLLPTIGAVAPMLTGLGVVAGGGALALDDLKKKAKELKGPFEEWQKVANKTVAPHTEKAVKSLKGAMKDLTPVIKTGADAFGRITEKAAKFADSPAFKSALAKNAEMGAKWVEEFAGSLGDFTQAFLDFGTKSQPALDAWQNLLGGLLDTGLPGMFKELEQGIGGSSEFLNGLAYTINESLLPGLGRVAGSFADAFGPLLGELLRAAADGFTVFSEVFEGAMKALKPVANFVADVVRSWREVFNIAAEAAGSFATNVGGALLESLLAVAGVDTSGLDKGFRGLSDWVKANQASIRGAFYNVAEAITTMVTSGIEMLPKLYSVFRFVVEGILTGVDGIISGLATAFGDLPVIGDKFKDWNTAFDDFAVGAREDLADVGAGIDSFVGEAVPRLDRAKLKLSVDEAEQNLNHIKEQLKDPELTKERRAKLTADKKAAEAALAQARADLAAFDRKQATAKLAANSSGFWNAIKAAAGAKLPGKTANVGANTSGFWGAIRSIPQVVAERQINVAYTAMNKVSDWLANGGLVRGYASGGDVQAFPNGGYVQGPGSGMSDSILAMMGSGAMARVSNTEYVIRAAAVQKYGVGFLDDVNAGRLTVGAGGGGGRAPWSSMLNGPRRPTGGTGAAAAAMGPVPVVLEIRAGDSSRYTQFLVQELQRAARGYGSAEAMLKPPRGR